MGAEWSSSDARWTVEVERGDTGETIHMTCGFLFTCTGYYRYDEGHTPELQGVERFAGDIVHPQFWTEDIDYAGKRVVVIGSGATAVTLVPALAQRAAHVTMLQRSPSYIISLPAVDPLAGLLGHVLPTRLAYPIVRWKNVMLTLAIYTFSRRRPAAMKRLIRTLLARRLPPGFDVDTHFNPRYEPWDQRMCLVPDGDLFDAIGDGRASVVTDHIETLTETGLALASGSELEADLIVTATGLKMVPFGAIHLRVDGTDVDLSAALVYRGMQVSGVPNMAFAFGYTNQSWTLGADLTCEQVCKLLEYMDRCGYAACVPRNRDPAITGRAIRRSHLGLRPAGDRPVPETGVTATPGRESRTTRATMHRCGAPESRIPRSSSRGPLRRPTRRRSSSPETPTSQCGPTSRTKGSSQQREPRLPPLAQSSTHPAGKPECWWQATGAVICEPEKSIRRRRRRPAPRRPGRHRSSSTGHGKPSATRTAAWPLTSAMKAPVMSWSSTTITTPVTVKTSRTAVPMSRPSAR